MRICMALCRSRQQAQKQRCTWCTCSNWCRAPVATEDPVGHMCDRSSTELHAGTGTPCSTSRFLHLQLDGRCGGSLQSGAWCTGSVARRLRKFESPAQLRQQATHRPHSQIRQLLVHGLIHRRQRVVSPRSAKARLAQRWVRFPRCLATHVRTKRASADDVFTLTDVSESEVSFACLSKLECQTECSCHTLLSSHCALLAPNHVVNRHGQ